jgi:hypothetical protein
VPGAASDLAGLLAFDSNDDSVLSQEDARFADFRVWQDRNIDGQVEAGEVLSLLQAGVAAIGLTASAVNETWELGEVVVIGEGSYTRADGGTIQFYDAALTYWA